jgi:hypothetical protein
MIGPSTRDNADGADDAALTKEGDKTRRAIHDEIKEFLRRNAQGCV